MSNRPLKARLRHTAPEALAEARAALDAIGSQWENALGRLKTFVEDDESQ
jgi:hypothetical protein